MPEPVSLENIYRHPDITKDNGLLRRWCHGRSSGFCSHYITTREVLDETFGCEARFDVPKPISWRLDSVTKAEMAEYILHQPRCRYCLQHDNSYLFSAWYDMSSRNAERIAARYAAFYPDNLKQPLIHVLHDRTWAIRLYAEGDNHNSTDGDIDADIYADTLVANFHIIIGTPPWDEAARGRPKEEGSWRIDTHRFELSTKQGWQEMLAAFPQPVRQT